ncbi:MAG: branched-chain amino acid transporter permease [Paenibacillaceae bacterium]|jgi:simple sugar transport system permease protein|nr:branched-chain amino acid transporter permease [Paenibacillaceae bacterium]
MNKWMKVFMKDSALVPLVAILLGLLAGAVIMLIGGFNPLKSYAALVEKVFGSSYDIGETMREITPLLLCGLSVAFAYRTGLFNIGAEGQLVMGMLGAVWVGVGVDLPAFIHAPLAIIAGMLTGGMWGAIVGWLKAARGINEVITSIMMNWIALYLANYLIGRFLLAEGTQRSGMINAGASITSSWLSGMFGGSRLHWGVLLAVLAVPVFYILLWKTKQGYELRAVGHNPHAAQYAGMNVKANIVKAMFVGGMFAGLAGVIEVLGVFGYMTRAAASTGHGFDGIAVALLGGNHPVGILFSSILFGFLTYGSAGMSFEADVPPEIIRVIIGLVIFFVAASGLVKWLFKPFMAKRKKEAAG